VSVRELEEAVAGLSRYEFAEFGKWFEQFAAEAWDRQIEEDVSAGRLDHLAQRADRDFEAGRCKEL